MVFPTMQAYPSFFRELPAHICPFQRSQHVSDDNNPILINCCDLKSSIAELDAACQSRQKTRLAFIFEQSSSFPNSSTLEMALVWYDNDFDALNSPFLFPFQEAHCLSL